MATAAAAGSSTGISGSTGKEPEIKLELTEEEGKEVQRRVNSKHMTDREREAMKLDDPAYPAGKRLMEACRDRAAKKARGPEGSPDGISRSVEMQRLQANNNANEQAMQSARDALFAAAVKNKHGAITAIPQASRATTGLGWLAAEVSKSWTNAVGHADARSVQAACLGQITSVLNAALRSDAINVATGQSTTAKVQQDFQTYIQGMRSKFTAKCGELTRMKAHSDAIAKDRDSQVAMLRNVRAELEAAKKRIAELEGNSGSSLGALASAAAAAAGSAGSSSSAPKAPARAMPVVPAPKNLVTASEIREASMITGMGVRDMQAFLTENKPARVPIQSIVNFRPLHESSKRTAIMNIVHAVKPPPMGQPPAQPEMVTRAKYDQQKERCATLEKHFRNSGLADLVEEDATVEPDVKSCLALMKKSGGPDLCARMVQIHCEQKKKMYHGILDQLLLKPNDIICCKWLSSGAASAVPMYALGVVQNVPHKDTPGAVNVQSMFLNDGCYETGKRIGFVIVPTLDSYEVVTKRNVRDFLDKVFDVTNVKHLHNNASKMNYTAKNLANYRDSLYSHTTSMLSHFMPNQSGMFTTYQRDCLKDPKAARAAADAKTKAAMDGAVDLVSDDEEDAVVSTLAGAPAAAASSSSASR